MYRTLHDCIALGFFLPIIRTCDCVFALSERRFTGRGTYQGEELDIVKLEPLRKNKQLVRQTCEAADLHVKRWKTPDLKRLKRLYYPILLLLCIFLSNRLMTFVLSLNSGRTRAWGEAMPSGMTRSLRSVKSIQETEWMNTKGEKLLRTPSAPQLSLLTRSFDRASGFLEAAGVLFASKGGRLCSNR